jgi:hypothetical protein
MKHITIITIVTIPADGIIIITGSRRPTLISMLMFTEEDDNKFTVVSYQLWLSNIRGPKLLLHLLKFYPRFFV